MAQSSAMDYETKPTFLTKTVDYIWDHKVPFLIIMAAVFFALHGFFAAYVSFNPEQSIEVKKVDAKLTSSTYQNTVQATSAPVTTQPLPSSNPPAVTKIITPKASAVTPINLSVLPTRIIIDKIGVDVQVSNPSSTNDAVLNKILLSSVLRYAGSGTIDSGNMLIMGHSSELPVIHNPLYKVFSKLKTLQAGDEIKIYAGATMHLYKVTSLRKVNTTASDAYVSFQSATPKLTLLTCNVLAEKNDRYLVEADLVY